MPVTGKPRDKVDHAFQNYLKEVKRHISKGEYTEYTLRTPFENLVNALIKLLDLPFEVQQEKERKLRLGAPDFTVLKGGPIGYIEAKNIDKNLESEQQSEQIKKYSAAIPNILLTNYRDFILIRDNQQIHSATLLPFPESELRKCEHVTDSDKQKFLSLFITLLSYDVPTIHDAQELAEALARRARLLKDLALEQLEEDCSIREFYSRDPSSWSKKVSSICDFHETIQDLIAETSIKKGFETTVDAYAQTITYGLFLARYHRTGKISRETAYGRIPESVPIIRTIFRSIADEERLPSNVSWILDELVNVLNATEIEAAMSKVSKDGKGFKDPFYMFYEHFLDIYDPDRRKRMGVYYTPSSVVHFITSSLHYILKTEFNKRHGLSDETVTLLDPAVGTGAFLSSAFSAVFDEMRAHGFGLRGRKVENHLLKNFFGFEVLITPYIISHLKLHDLLGHAYDEKRVQVYLTDTLNPSDKHDSRAWFRDLSDESRIADEIKINKQILVVLGNPPYSGESSNKGKWIRDLLKNGYKRLDGSTSDGYFTVDGQPLHERNSKWLQDDYVKFIRFCQWKIDSSGEGIVGLITNHGYLDNQSFRGMRQSLLNTFERIYVLNLHGNINKKEKAPDGGKDDNVFDIRQGVAISLFIKNSKFKDRRVFYADLYGEKLEKYAWLNENSFQTVSWREVFPQTPYYFFTPVDRSLFEEYERGWKITDIFRVNSVGVVTARDKLTIQWTPEDIATTVIKFAKMKPEEARAHYKLGQDATEWKVADAQADLIRSGLDEDKITPILYRPFDLRYTYFTGTSRGFVGRPRSEVMSHMKHPNLGLIFHRREELPIPYTHFLATNRIVEHICLSSKTTCYLAPLFLYSDAKNGFKKESNVNPRLTEALTTKYGREPAAEEIFYYVYAVAYSTSFRTTFNELLRTHGPRIPFTDDYALFMSLVDAGRKLVTLHLMNDEMDPSTEFCGEGSKMITSAPKKVGDRVYINKDQYFDGVPEQVWDFHVGSYQVLYKWLAYRKGRELTNTEIWHFLQVVEVIKQTIELMTEIEEIIHV